MVDIGRLTCGHGLMALCCLLYLVWWCVFFWPNPEGHGVRSRGLRVFGVVCILGAVVTGIAAVVQLVAGSTVDAPAVSPLVIWGVAIVAYLVLLMVTTRAFHRQPTTELVLFAAWAAFECSVLSALVGCSGVAIGIGAVMYGVLIAGAFVVSLVCYVLYYRLGPVPSFVDGCIPLATIGVVEALLPAVTALA